MWAKQGKGKREGRGTTRRKKKKSKEGKGERLMDDGGEGRLFLVLCLAPLSACQPGSRWTMPYCMEHGTKKNA